MMKNFVRAATVAAVLSLGVTANASAATINLALGNNEFDIEWLHDVQPLEATAHFTATVTNTFIDFTVAISNLSPAVGSGIQSFGFNINPDVTAVSVTTAGAVFGSVGLEANLPSIDNNIDVCIFAANGCSGGGQGGNLDGGSSDTISFRLTGPFTNGATLTTFGIKFQTAFGSFEFEGNEPNGENPPPNGENPPTSVPEPTSMVLVGLGLASVLGTRRRN